MMLAVLNHMPVWAMLAVAAAVLVGLLIGAIPWVILWREDK